MIKNPTLKPMPGMVEVERSGRRFYKNVRTGEIIEPGVMKNEDEEAQAEFLKRFRKTDEYALLEYVLMMEGVL